MVEPLVGWSSEGDAGWSRRLGVVAVELASICGVELDGWQAGDLVRLMLSRSSDEWVSTLVCYIISRQNGKGEVLQAREFVGIVKLVERVLHTAHHMGTSKDAFRRAGQRVQLSSDLFERMTNQRFANGEESLEFGAGLLEYRARTGKAGRGLTDIDLIVYDEAQHLTEEQMAASSPAQAVAEFPQTLLTGSAGLETSVKMWELRRSAIMGLPDGVPVTGRLEVQVGRMLWIEYTAEIITRLGDVFEIIRPDVEDRAGWARANPSFPHRISEEFLEDQLVKLGPEKFAREHLGVWDELKGGVSRQNRLKIGDWMAAADENSSIVSGLVLAAAASPDLGSVSVVAGGRRHDGARHVELVRLSPGSEWFRAWFSALVGRQRPVEIGYVASGPSRALKSDLRAVADEWGVKLVAVSGPDMAAACASLCEAFPGVLAEGEERQVWHLGGDRLAGAVRSAGLVAAGTGFVWAEGADGRDVSPLVGATVADWLAKAQPVRRSAYEDGGLMTV